MWYRIYKQENGKFDTGNVISEGTSFKACIDKLKPKNSTDIYAITEHTRRYSIPLSVVLYSAEKGCFLSSLLVRQIDSWESDPAGHLDGLAKDPVPPKEPAIALPVDGSCQEVVLDDCDGVNIQVVISTTDATVVDVYCDRNSRHPLEFPEAFAPGRNPVFVHYAARDARLRRWLRWYAWTLVGEDAKEDIKLLNRAIKTLPSK